MSDLDRKIVSGDGFSNCISLASKENPLYVSFLNPFSYYIVSENDEIKNNIDVFFSDGALLCKLHSLFHGKITRASFDYSSIAAPFFQHCISNNYTVMLIGATEEEMNVCVNNIKEKFGDLNIVSHQNGYISNLDKTIEQIELLNPDVIIAGMGTPIQEEFIVKIKKSNAAPAIAITCGGFFTQTSIRSDYYYGWVKKLGLRWLQRAIMHKHVRRRLVCEYPVFIMKYLAHNLRLIGRKK